MLRRIAQKKVAQEERQPGQVSEKLKRRMGPAHAQVFNEVGKNLYSSIVLTVKESLEKLFNEHMDALETQIKEELGNRGLEEAAAYFAPWMLEVMEDVINFGMKDISGKLEEIGNSAAAKFVKKTEEEEEAGEEDLFGTDEETEEPEKVEEEPVAPPEGETPPEGEAPPEGGEEAPAGGLEELMATPPAGEAPATNGLKARVWRKQGPVKKKIASTSYVLTASDVIRAAGGEAGIRKHGSTVSEVMDRIADVQKRLIAKMVDKFGTVQEANPQEILDWAISRFPYTDRR